MATIRTTGASLLNTVDISANNISVFDNQQEKYVNINEVYVHNSQIIEATKSENNKYEYPTEDINDHNVSGLQSMINYFNTHTGKKPNYYFYEDSTNINIKKKINNSLKNIHLTKTTITIKLQEQLIILRKIKQLKKITVYTSRNQKSHLRRIIFMMTIPS